MSDEDTSLIKSRPPSTRLIADTDPDWGRGTKGEKGIYSRIPASAPTTHEKHRRWLASLGAGKFSPTFETRQEALDARAKARLRKSSGRPAPTNTKVTVAQLAAELKPKWEAEFRYATLQQHNLGLRYCLDQVGHLKVAALSYERLSQLRADFESGAITEKPLATTSTDRYMAPLREILNEAVRRGLIDANPFSVLRRRKRAKRRAKSPTRDEVLLILAAAKTYDQRKEARYTYYPILATAAYTGARIGEILALRVKDVDLVAGTLEITGSLNRAGEIGEPKTEAGRRVVGIPAPLVDVLAMAIPAEAAPDSFVFHTKGNRNKPIAYGNLRRRGWEEILSKAGLAESGYTFHSLRHATASLLHAQGLSDAQVARQLGHASPAVTKSVYQHTWDAEEAERALAAGAIAEGLGPRVEE